MSEPLPAKRNPSSAVLAVALPCLLLFLWLLGVLDDLQDVGIALVIAIVVFLETAAADRRWARLSAGLSAASKP